MPRPALKTIYKAFVRPYLDYGDVIYDEGYNEAFHKILESIQYNAWLALSRTIRGSSREKLYQELGLESLQRRRWYRKLSLFYKIFKERKPVYFFNLTPTKILNYNTRNTDKITLFRTKHNFFKNYLFSSTVTEWNQLDPNLQSAASLNVFKKNSKFIRPSPNSVFNCHNCKVIKYLTRLRPGLSHLREHKFKHSFQDTVNPFCSCRLDVETNMHFFLYCRLFSNKRCTLLSKVNDIFSSLTNTDDITLNDIPFFGEAPLDITANTLILNATMNYILSYWSKFILVFCNFHLNLYLFNFFRILISFLRLYIHISPSFFYIFYEQYYFLNISFMCTQFSFEYLRHLVICWANLLSVIFR